MNLLRLDDDEVTIINTFVNEASQNPLTDGIILFPHYDNDKNIKIEVIAIRNISLQYSSKIANSATISKRATRLKELSGLVSKYNLLLSGKRLSFDISNIDDYNVVLLHEAEMRHMKTLLSSSILFDRFGNILDRQNRSKKYISKYNNIPDIDNIDSIVNMDKRFVKQKK